MKKIYLLLLIFLPFFSCKNNCEDLECISESAFAFTIRSADSDVDLLFGPNATLATDDVEVYYMMNGAKRPAQVQVLPDHIAVFLESGIREYYITALEKTDIIQVDFTQVPSSECCPSTIRIDQRSVNGTLVAKNSWVISLFR